MGGPRSGSLDHTALVGGLDVCNPDSMEMEVRVIVCRGNHCVTSDSTPASRGLGSRMAALFAVAGLDTPIKAWLGQEAEPADFGARSGLTPMW